MFEADDGTDSIRGATKHFESPKNTATLTICRSFPDPGPPAGPPAQHPVYGEREFLANPK